jgi:hypothetical protein
MHLTQTTRAPLRANSALRGAPHSLRVSGLGEKSFASAGIEHRSPGRPVCSQTDSVPQLPTSTKQLAHNGSKLCVYKCLKCSSNYIKCLCFHIHHFHLAVSCSVPEHRVLDLRVRKADALIFHHGYKLLRAVTSEQCRVIPRSWYTFITSPRLQSITKRFNNESAKVVVELLTLLLCIWKAPGPSLGPVIGNPRSFQANAGMVTLNSAIKTSL